MEPVTASRTIKWNIRLFLNVAVPTTIITSEIHIIVNITLQWKFEIHHSYLESKPNGEPHNWHPVQMRSSAKWWFGVSYTLRLRNIRSVSIASRFAEEGRNISPIDAKNVALQEMSKRKTSISEEQCRTSVTSCSFQFLTCNPVS